MSFKDGQSGSGEGGSIFSSSDVGQHQNATSAQGQSGHNDGFSSVDSFISQNPNLASMVGRNQPNQQEPNTQALLEAFKNKDLRAFVKLAGIDQSTALAQIPSVSEDDTVASLRQEIAGLKERLQGNDSWISEQKKSYMQQQEQQQIKQDKERLNSLLDENEHFCIQKFDGLDMLYDTIKDFKSTYRRPPNESEIKQLANAVEDSLFEKVQSIREMQLPERKVGAQLNAGGNGTGTLPTQKLEQTLGSRPTISNTSHPSTRADSNELDISDEACLKRAMEALMSGG